MAVVGPKTFAQIAAAPRGQIVVSHSSAEVELIAMEYTLSVEKASSVGLLGRGHVVVLPLRGDPRRALGATSSKEQALAPTPAEVREATPHKVARPTRIRTTPWAKERA